MNRKIEFICETEHIIKCLINNYHSLLHHYHHGSLDLGHTSMTCIYMYHQHNGSLLAHNPLLGKEFKKNLSNSNLFHLS